MAKVNDIKARAALTPDKTFKVLAERNVTPAQLRAVIDQVQNPEPVMQYHREKWGTNSFKFGLCSDVHVG